MIAWLIVFVVFVIIGYFVSEMVGEKVYEKALKSGLNRYDAENRTGWFVVPVFILIAFVIPVGSTKFFEYPSLVLKPSVATFDNAGNPVYHKWGLVTLPWNDKLEAANVPYPDECKVVDDFHLYNENTRFLVEKDGKVYAISLEARTCLENPSVYYAKKERRKIGFPEFELMHREVAQDLIFFQIKKLEHLKEIARESCKLEEVTLNAYSRCQALEDALLNESGVQARTSPDGYALYIRSRIGVLNYLTRE
jgi:hypothetical protein